MAIDRREGVSHEKELVRAAEDAYDRAWCAGVAVGREAIRQVLGASLASEGSGSQHRSSLKRITFVRRDIAIVDEDAVITGRRLEDPLAHAFTDVVGRSDDDRWVIAHVRAYHFQASK